LSDALIELEPTASRARRITMHYRTKHRLRLLLSLLAITFAWPLFAACNLIVAEMTEASRLSVQGILTAALFLAITTGLWAMAWVFAWWLLELFA